MYASIKFDKEAHFQSRGRNGYLNTHGVAVYNMGIGEFEEVHLHPITSRGEASDACRVVIRKSAIPDLIKALIDALGPPPRQQLRGLVASGAIAGKTHRILQDNEAGKSRVVLGPEDVARLHAIAV